MGACTCQDSSPALLAAAKLAPGGCASLKDHQGAWIHRDPYNNGECPWLQMFCVSVCTKRVRTHHAHQAKRCSSDARATPCPPRLRRVPRAPCPLRRATGRLLMCDQGPFLYATRSLATIKASPQLAMHLGDQIAPVNCSTLGFTVMSVAA